MNDYTSILQPVSLKKNRKRYRKAACIMWLAGVGAAMYLILYFAGGVK